MRTFCINIRNSYIDEIVNEKKIVLFNDISYFILYLKLSLLRLYLLFLHNEIYKIFILIHTYYLRNDPIQA